MPLETREKISGKILGFNKSKPGPAVLEVMCKGQLIEAFVKRETMNIALSGSQKPRTKIKGTLVTDELGRKFISNWTVRP